MIIGLKIRLKKTVLYHKLIFFVNKNCYPVVVVFASFATCFPEQEILKLIPYNNEI